MKQQEHGPLRLFIELAKNEQGAILSTELILVSIVAVVGMITGLASMRDSMVSELSDIAGSVQSINQSYSYTGTEYTRLADGSIEILLDIEPEHESEEGDVDPPIEHIIGGVGSLDFNGGVTTGVGGSASGTIGDGTTDTGFRTTTDTGEVLGTAGNSIFFSETPGTGVPGGTYGEFSSSGTDRELLQQVSVGGANYVQDPTVNGASSQGVGRIVFTDIPDPGPHCVGISSVSFDRRGGPNGFRANFSFSGSVVDIQP